MFSLRVFICQNAYFEFYLPFLNKIDENVPKSSLFVWNVLDALMRTRELTLAFLSEDPTLEVATTLQPTMVFV